MAFLKGYRTYLAIILTALAVGLNQLGILSDDLLPYVVGALSAFGLYFRSQD